MSAIFSGKVALVTGAANGIGRATALAFAQNGLKVVVSDIDATGGKNTVDAITAAGGEAVFFQCDVTHDDQVRALVNGTIARYERLDYAFNNAGIEIEQSRVADGKESDFDAIMNVNVKGVWLCMKYQIPAMLAQGGGAIVNTASVAGLIGLPTASNYVAAKHGVVGITKTAALEYATDNIRVNCVNPGYIKTPMTDPTMATRFVALMEKVPMKRLGVPEEIAEAVVWMLSDRASFMTGVSHIVDGGYTAA